MLATHGYLVQKVLFSNMCLTKDTIRHNGRFMSDIMDVLAHQSVHRARHEPYLTALHKFREIETAARAEQRFPQIPDLRHPRRDVTGGEVFDADAAAGLPAR